MNGETTALSYSTAQSPPYVDHSVVRVALYAPSDTPPSPQSMAIGKAAKWISFATPQQTPSSSAVAHDTVHSTHSIADEKQFGLENFGNTCYANSVLQALYFCSPFRDLVIQSTDISAPPVPPSVSRLTPPILPTATSVLPRRKSERGKPASDVPSSAPTPTQVIPSAPPTLFSALRSLYVFISRNSADKGAVAPRAFIDKLRDGNEHFRGVMHQDAHEFLNYLLNKIVEEIQYDKHHKQQDKEKDASSSNASREDLSGSTAATLANNAPTPIIEFPHQSGTLVHRLFEGTLTSETRCLTCETVSSRDESFLDLSIDIEQNSSVTACLRQFSASEMLCQRNKFFCDSCCGLQEAEKRMKIKRLPNILALHLKRFKYQEELKKYIKLTYRVAFPFELRLFNTVDDVENPDRLYELFGIVVHIGNGPHHGHYVAIVKGPHSWLMFDDDKIEVIKESEIPRYFGDAASGSAYVLYYQAVDLDPASLGIKVPVPPAVPDVSIAVSPAYATTTNGLSSLESPDPALPPGLGEPPATSPAAESIPHPPIPTAPSSPSLATSPLVGSVTLPSRKKSLPSIRIPAPESSSTSPTASGRTHGGLFNTFRSSQGSSKTRPSTSDGIVSRGAPEEVPPPVPPVPQQYLNGKEVKDHDKEKDRDKGGEKEREDERSSKEFDRRPSLWFKRRSAKSTRDEREKEKEKEKEKESKGAKDKDTGSAPGHATTSAAALSAVPSQSDAGSSVSGASSLWRRSSARVGHHVKRLSGTNSSTTLGEADATATAPPPGGSLGSNSSPSHPHPHPHPQPHPQPHSHPHQHHHHHRHHHHHHHHHREPPGQLPTVPATPQIVQSDWEPSTPSSTSSSSPVARSRHTQAQHRHPLLPVSNTDDDELLTLPLLPVSAEEADMDSSSFLPAWCISPASPPGESSGSVTSTTSAVLPHHHSGEPTSMVDDNDEAEEDDNDDVVSDDHDHEHENPHEHGHGRSRLRAPAGLRFFTGRRRGRPHSVHGSGSCSGGSVSPRERSTSPQQHQGGHQEVAAPAASQPASAPASSTGMTFPSRYANNDATATPAPAPAASSSASSSSTSAAAAASGLRRAARKLSLNAPLFGLGLGLGFGLGGGGRDKDRDPHEPHPHPQQHHHFFGIGKKEDGGQKTPHRIHSPSSIFGSAGSGAGAGAGAGTGIGVSAALASALP